MLRRYRGLLYQGYGVKDKTVSYEPFKLVLSFREAPEETPRDQSTFPEASNGSSILLIICVIPVKSVYTGQLTFPCGMSSGKLSVKLLSDFFCCHILVSNEILLQRSPKFSTRHTATGILAHIDGSSVSAFGYLPQDIIGKQIMDFYHPEDLVFLKDVYEMVMKKGQIAGSTFCSRPYRFLIKNGCFITLETEWTSFVNPWSRKLEFVIGNHRVLQGIKPSIFHKNVNTLLHHTQNMNICFRSDALRHILDHSKLQLQILGRIDGQCQTFAGRYNKIAVRAGIASIRYRKRASVEAMSSTRFLHGDANWRCDASARFGARLAGWDRVDGIGTWFGDAWWNITAPRLLR